MKGGGRNLAVLRRSTLHRWIHAMLTDPRTMRIKRVLRNVRWRLTAGASGNPAVPARVQSLLFVCLGNICRSPFAAALAARELGRCGRLDVCCASAGIRTTQAARAPREACEAASVYGLDLTSHEPRSLTRGLMEASNMVIVMESAHAALLRSQYPELADRVFLLSPFDSDARDAYERRNIADPFGGPRAEFDLCYRRIYTAVTHLVGSITAPVETQPAAATRPQQVRSC
jgi:protein-tyrosine phosphatase